MKLLIITQVIDTEHPILGFFHRWVIEFARHCEHVHVIALQVGHYDLPANVTVHTLGKEVGMGKLRYLYNFYRLIISLRHEYDSVFVHMNQIYVILGAPFWRLWGKRVGLWYAHGAVTNSLTVAVVLAHLVFTSTEQGMRIVTKKRRIVGQGIDTDVFTATKRVPLETLRLVTVGRISQSKNIQTLIMACAQLKQRGLPFSFRIVGPATTPAEEQYANEMRVLVTTLGLAAEITWVGSLPQAALPIELHVADIFIHDGVTNSLDKALLEAALCGCVVISSNPSYHSITSHVAPELLYSPGNADELVSIITAVYTDRVRYTQIQQAVTNFLSRTHSVSNLISGIVIKY